MPSAYSVTMNGNKTEYLYDATGMKREARYSYALTQMQIPLGETATENTGSNLLSRSHTDYCGSYIYENDKISRILTPEGYIRTADTIPMNNMGKWKYTYFLKDHLGNTRAQLACDSIGVSGSTAYTVAGTTDYYPFGMETSPSNGQLTSGTNPYLYNGKEMDRMNGLNMYDYGARWRGGDVPSWPTPDPLAEKYYSISPYAYCLNNPIIIIDPDGKDLIKVLVPANANASKTKTILIDSKAAAQFSRFAWGMNSKYGLVVNSDFRSKSKQAEMRARWDKGDRKNLVCKPATKSAHSGGFAVDMDVSSLGLSKYNYTTSENEKLMKELSTTAAIYGFSYGGDFNTPDVPHFYLDETDFGYESRDEAMDVNDEYMKEHGDEIPTYDKKAANDDKDSNSSTTTWDQALALISSWLSQNPNIILK